MDWILILVPLCIVYLAVVTYLGLLVDYHGYYHFHTVLQTPVPLPLHVVLFGLELIAVVMGVTMWGYFAGFQLLFILQWNHVRNEVARVGKSRKAKMGTESIREDPMTSFSLLRTMQLRVIYFNRIFAAPIYFCKLLCLIDSTWGTFMFIKCCRSQPLVACLGLFIALTDGSWYAIFYGQAHKVEDNVIEWKQKLALLVGTGGQDWRERKELLGRSVKSVPDFGIKAGSFGRFHRGTALEFYDFIVNSVCNLLISVPGTFRA